MGIFNREKFDNFEELFHEQLKDLYDAEHRIAEALPKMIEKASSPRLTQAMQHHLEETNEQIKRLEHIFSMIGSEAEREKCEAIVGLIKQGEDMINAKGAEEVIDAGLIAAAQRIEHYEMAGYGSARNFAQRLGHIEAAALLEETLNEEKHADRTLTDIAEGDVNLSAQAVNA